MTTSSPNVIATVLGTFEGQEVPTWANQLNLVFSSPVNAVGAFFGNDQIGLEDRTGFTERLSVFRDNDTLLGSVIVDSNNNTNVDQFIGVQRCSLLESSV